MRMRDEAPLEVFDDVLDVEGNRDPLRLHPQDPLALDSLVLRLHRPAIGDPVLITEQHGIRIGRGNVVGRHNR
jgi:hypothetical protein